MQIYGHGTENIIKIQSLEIIACKGIWKSVYRNWNSGRKKNTTRDILCLILLWQTLV